MYNAKIQYLTQRRASNTVLDQCTWDPPSGGRRIRRRQNRAPVIGCGGCVSPPPPFLLIRSAAGGAAARLLRPILALGRPRLSLPSALYRESSLEEGWFRIPPPLFPLPEPEPV